MGHVVTLGLELRSPVHGILQGAQKLWCDLLLTLHCRFDRCECKLSGMPFKLMKDFSCLHWVLPGPRSFSIVLRPQTPPRGKMLSIGGDDETHLTFKTRLVSVHSAGEVRVLPPGSARFPSLGE